MKDISFYLIHNNSKDRIDLRNKLNNISNNLKIKLIEIYKQNKNLKIKLSLKNKLIISRIYFLRIYYDLKHKNEFSFKFYLLLLRRLIYLNKSIFNLIFQNKNKNIETFKSLKIESIVTGKHIKENRQNLLFIS